MTASSKIKELVRPHRPIKNIHERKKLVISNIGRLKRYMLSIKFYETSFSERKKFRNAYLDQCKILNVIDAKIYMQKELSFPFGG